MPCCVISLSDGGKQLLFLLMFFPCVAQGSKANLLQPVLRAIPPRVLSNKISHRNKHVKRLGVSFQVNELASEQDNGLAQDLGQILQKYNDGYGGFSSFCFFFHFQQYCLGISRNIGSRISTGVMCLVQE